MERPLGENAGQSSRAGFVVKRKGSPGPASFDVDVVVILRLTVPGKGDPAAVVARGSAQARIPDTP